MDVSTQWHPYAEIFPWIEGAAFEELKADIAKHGVLEPIVFFEGKILDGRNRHKAASELGIPFQRKDYDGDDPLGFVISHNLTRRHLDEGQRAMVATKLASLGRGRPSEKAANLPVFQIKQEAAAALLNVSERAVRSARVVKERGTPELVAAVEQGKVAVSTAETISGLPKDEQSKIIAKGSKAVKEAAKQVRQSKKKPSATKPAVEPEKKESPNSNLPAVIERRSSIIEIRRVCGTVKELPSYEKAVSETGPEPDIPVDTDIIRKAGEWLLAFANEYDLRYSKTLSKAAIKEAFEEWWKLYPKKIGKADVEKRYARIVMKRMASIEDLMSGLLRYRESRVGEDPKFTLQPATWLNQGRWADEIPVSAGSRSRKLSKAESAAAGIDAYLNAYMGAQNEQSRGNPALTFDGSEEHKIGGN